LRKEAMSSLTCCDLNDFLAAMADETRQRTLALLGECEMSVSQLSEHFALSQPMMSYHLAILRRVHLVISRRKGQYTFYRALARAEALLTQKADSGRSAEYRPKTVHSAVKNDPTANMAVISVAGRYAATEAWAALRQGLHVLLFSDNVSVEDEVALKNYAREHNLLLMGPDAGTAIINGVALGFANVVPHGPVGIVSAAGTGLQEVSTLLAKLGVGTSQGIGTGGRDVKESIGGIMMIEGLKALQADPSTKTLLLVSKPPDPSVAEKILAQVKASSKPTVVCFLGGDPETVQEAGAIPARTLQEAAYLMAAQTEGYQGSTGDEVLAQEMHDLATRAAELKESLKPEQKYLRGLFSGGTLAAEAVLLWNEQIGGVWSNIVTNKKWRIPDATKSQEHTVVDLGEDEFTVGRPHPMIDNDLRIRRMLQEANDPSVAVVMLDVVLGYGAHPDPASELGPAIRQMKAIAAKRGQELIVVGAVTGTENDPQRLSKQIAALEASGMIVLTSNAAAAKLAALIVK
jgi:succinyl-CoA synthetase alpha subunit